MGTKEKVQKLSHAVALRVDELDDDGQVLNLDHLSNVLRPGPTGSPNSDRVAPEHRRSLFGQPRNRKSKIPTQSRELLALKVELGLLISNIGKKIVKGVGEGSDAFIFPQIFLPTPKNGLS